MPQRTPTPVILEPEYIEGFRQIYEEKIVFNKTLGLKLVSVTPEGVVARMLREPAAREAFGAFMEKRKPDFSKL